MKKINWEHADRRAVIANMRDLFRSYLTTEEDLSLSIEWRTRWLEKYAESGDPDMVELTRREVEALEEERS